MPELRNIPISDIRIPDVRVSSILNPEQRALMESTIKEIGVVQDIVVRPHHAGGYELVAGKSRLQTLAAQGAVEIQAKVIDADEKLGLIMNIVENVARGSYDYISIARTIRKLKDLGATSEELERIFPWKSRWITFIEDLQDLPVDVVQAISDRKVTPTHVQLALNLPTPFEVHDGLRTAITHEWDTGTFKTFVQNRVEQIQRARQRAESMGGEPEIPPAQPQQLIQYRQCLVCGYKKPREKVTTQMICDDCQDLVRYVTSQVGPPEEAIKVVYEALRSVYEKPPSGVPISAAPRPSPPAPASTKPPPPAPAAAAEDRSFVMFQVLTSLREGRLQEDQARSWLLTVGFDPTEVDRAISRVRGAPSPT